jgi:hypothetical protein
VADAVNTMDVPAGCGATRSPPMLVKVSTPPEVVVDGVGLEVDAADIGYARLPLEPELS